MELEVDRGLAGGVVAASTEAAAGGPDVCPADTDTGALQHDLVRAAGRIRGELHRETVPRTRTSPPVLVRFVVLSGAKCAGY